MATSKDVSKMMAVFASVYPVDLSKEKTEVYSVMLADIPAEVLDATTKQLLSTCKFFPSIAEIRDAAFAISAPDMPDALTAWQEVYKAIRRYGYDKRPEFDNPIINTTVKALGWSSLCLAEDDNWLVKRFCDAYQVYAKRHADDAKMLPAVKATRQQLQAQTVIMQLSEGMRK